MEGIDSKRTVLISNGKVQRGISLIICGVYFYGGAFDALIEEE